MGLSVERAGGLDRVARHADLPGDRFETDVRIKKVEGRSIPWFRYGGPHSSPEKGPMVMWVAEMLPPFSVERRGYLAEKYRPELQLLNLRAITLALPAADRDWLATTLPRMGWQVRREGESLVAGDGEMTLTIRPGEQSRGLVEVVFRLAREVAKATVAIGPRSTLELGPGAKARWRFQPIATSSADSSDAGPAPPSPSTSP
jgi:hypothetical protein